MVRPDLGTVNMSKLNMCLSTIECLEEAVNCLTQCALNNKLNAILDRLATLTPAPISTPLPMAASHLSANSKPHAPSFDLHRSGNHSDHYANSTSHSCFPSPFIDHNPIFFSLCLSRSRSCDDQRSVRDHGLSPSLS